MKELNEFRIWLAIAARSGVLPAERLSPVADECDQLARIIAKSIHTVNQRQSGNGASR